MRDMELLILFGLSFIGSLALVVIAMITKDIIEMRRNKDD